VGENLQDHALVGISYEVRDSHTSLDALRDPVLLNEALTAYATEKKGPFAEGVQASAFVPLTPSLSGRDDGDLAEDISIENTNESINSTFKEQEILLRSTLLQPKETVSQLMLLPFQVHCDLAHDQQELFRPSAPGSFLTLTAQIARPFSRGYVHIQSGKSSDHPTINPRYLSHPMDMKIICRQVRNLDILARTEPLASQLLKGGRTIPANFSSIQSLDTVKTFIKDTLTTQYHPVGTCAMLPLEKGGVVDPTLKVYGTSNLRVIDASVFPTHLRGNIQSTVYAVAEYGADIIKRELRLTG
jgi:choline dehydrogenase-like flavoprotein